MAMPGELMAKAAAQRAGMNLLLSCIGKRGYVADYFREVLPKGGRIIGTSNTPWTPGFSRCDETLVLPPIRSDEYVPSLLAECRRLGVSGLLSFFDPDVHKLSAHRNELGEAGVLAWIPARRASTIAFDKLETWRSLSAMGIATPRTTDSPAEARAWLASGLFAFPLIVKPRFGFGGVNTFLARNPRELEVFHGYTRDMIIQQFVEGEHFCVDGLGDTLARPVCVVPWRRLLTRNGETERAETVHCGELSAIAERLIREVEITGPLDVDFLRDGQGGLWVLEMNPRFGGGYPVSHLAGADFPGLIVRMLAGEELENRSGKHRAGVTMMKRLEPIPGPEVV
jgi:carbamoyl-phosphate synthase large subunit